MQTDSLYKLVKLAQEIQLYNKWILILNKGEAPTASYESAEIQQRRLEADGWYEMEENGLFDVGVFSFELILDDCRNQAACVRKVRESIRDQTGLQATLWSSLDTSQINDQEDAITLYSILTDQLGEDPENITLGYSMFPMTKKLVEEMYPKKMFVPGPGVPTRAFPEPCVALIKPRAPLPEPCLDHTEEQMRDAEARRLRMEAADAKDRKFQEKLLRIQQKQLHMQKLISERRAGEKWTVPEPTKSVSEAIQSPIQQYMLNKQHYSGCKTDMSKHLTRELEGEYDSSTTGHFQYSTLSDSEVLSDPGLRPKIVYVPKSFYSDVKPYIDRDADATLPENDD